MLRFKGCTIKDINKLVNMYQGYGILIIAINKNGQKVYLNSNSKVLLNYINV